MMNNVSKPRGEGKSDLLLFDESEEKRSEVGRELTVAPTLDTPAVCFQKGLHGHSLIQVSQQTLGSIHGVR